MADNIIAGGSPSDSRQPPTGLDNGMGPDQGSATKGIMKKRIDGFNEHRRSRLITIKANAAYLCGHQNIQIVNNTLLPLKSQYATPVVCNLILPAVTNDISVATRQQAIFDVVPAGTDADDKATATACQKILPYLLRINPYNLCRESVILWYDLDGVGWRKVYWDPYATIHGVNPQDPEDETYNPAFEPGGAVFEGEVKIRHVPNNRVIYDWRKKSLKDLDWIIHADTVTVGWAKQMYGKEIFDESDGVAIQKQAAMNDEFEIAVMGEFAELAKTIAPTSVTPNDGTLLDDDKTVEYYEYWHKPTKGMPTGAFAVMIGNKMIVDGPYPTEQYPHKELPLIYADPMAFEGVMVGSASRISQARPLQREYNELRSSVKDSVDVMGNSIFWVPRGAKLNFKKIANINGNYVEFDGPQKPTREMGVQIPGTFFAYMQEVKKGIDDIFAFHDPSKGIQPRGGPRSATGLQALQTANFTQLTPMMAALEESDQKVIAQALNLAVANYNEKLFTIVGDDHRWAVQKIDREQLKGKINVIVRRSSSMPLDKEQAAQKAMQVWQAGLLGDPQDPQVRIFTLKQMDLGNVDGILQITAKQTNFAKREFTSAEEYMKGMPPLDPNASVDEIQAHLEQWIYIPPPNQFDDHHVHISEHREYILDNYWKFIGSDAPQYKILMQAMVGHATVHEQMLSQAQQSAMQAQMMAAAFEKGNTQEQILLKQVAALQSAKAQMQNNSE